MNLGTHAAQQPNKVAVQFGNLSRSYAELDRRSRALAGYLHAQGLRQGDHVAIMMENRLEWFDAAWAAQRSGLYYTPVNWHLTKDEAAFVIRDCGAKAVITSDTLAPLAAHILPGCPDVHVAITAGEADEGFLGLEEICATSAVDTFDHVEGVYFFYSSGTTGQPKGIVPAHDFPPFGAALAFEHLLGPAFGFNANMTYLCPAPLYHAAPLGWSLGTHRYGGTVVVLDRFDARECLASVERHRVTHAQFVPTHFVRLLKLPDADRDYDISSLEIVVHAAAPCPVEVKEQMIAWFGQRIVEFYAGSEGIGMTSITSQDWLRHRGSVGKALGGAIHILDENGIELPAGEVGSVYFETAATFSYHNDPDKTASVYNEHGWATLGDLGSLDDDGFLYLADRRSDLIVSGGVNVYPAEIEQALIMHPDVADVAVIGVADEEMGQAVRAVIQAAPGAAPTPEELTVWARERLAGFKVPRSYVFTPAIPRLPTGKLLRRQVRLEHG